jgi:hypothetical protein
LSKAQTTSRVHAIPQLRFEQQQLTSFSGLVLFQMLFNALGLRARLARCFRAARGVAYGTHVLFVQLVVHVLLGFRSLRDRDHCADDPLVARVCGVRRLADVATLSRRLRGCTDAEADAVDARVLRPLLHEPEHRLHRRAHGPAFEQQVDHERGRITTNERSPRV